MVEAIREGGGILLECGTLEGVTGSISASGGDGHEKGGGGGGGRVAIHYNHLTFDTNNISVVAGSGKYNTAEAGTIFCLERPWRGTIFSVR